MLRNILTSWWNKLVSIFSKKSDTSLPVSNDAFHKGLEASMRKLMNEFTPDIPDEKMPQLILTNVLFTGNRVFGPEGERDGKNGSRNRQVTAKARAHAALVSTHITSITKGKIQAYQSELDTIKNSQPGLKEKSRKAEKQYKRAQKAMMRKPWNYSVVACILFFLFFALAFVADIPLTINLVGHLNIGHTDVNDPDISFWKKLEDLDLLFFSLGICSLGAMIKHVYDEYLNYRTGSLVAEFARMKKKYPDRTGLIKTGHYLKMFFKLGITAFIIYTLYNLAQFRNAFTVITSQDPAVRNYTLWSFLGITILLPLVSGVCLSLALYMLGNIRHQRRLHKRTEEYAAAIQRSQISIPALEKKITSLRVFEADWSQNIQPGGPQTSDHVSNIAMHFIAAYNQAYKYAFLDHHRDDEYTIMQQLRSEEIFDHFHPSIN